MGEHNLKRADLIEAIAYFPIRSERWINGALAAGEDLLADTACEIALRLHHLGAHFPAHLLTEIGAVRFRPLFLVFEHECVKIARALVEIASRTPGIGRAKASRLEEPFARFLAPYEDFFKSVGGKHLMKMMRSYYRGSGNNDEWKVRLSQFGASLAPSAIKVLDDEYRQRFARLSLRRKN